MVIVLVFLLFCFLYYFNKGEIYDSILMEATAADSLSMPYNVNSTIVNYKLFTGVNPTVIWALLYLLHYVFWYKKARKQLINNQCPFKSTYK